MNRYRRPPITEAVIEVRVEGQVHRETIDKLQKRLMDNYPLCQEAQIVDVEFSAASTKVQQQFQGYRLIGKDGADTILITPASIGTARLAPYEGWEKFIAKGRQNWEEWKRLVGHRKIIRVGVPYINRIDVSDPHGTGVRIADYLSFYPQMPEIGLQPMANFALNTVSPLGNGQFKLILNAGSVASPLVKHVSFVLDLDLSGVADLPQKDDNLWAFIDGMRNMKNQVFEGCITDRTRELFS